MTDREKPGIFKRIAIGIIVVAAFLIVIAIIYYPGLQKYFMRQGFEYAREKTMATMPAIDGYNPEIHAHDPLILSESFKAIMNALEIDELADDTLKRNAYEFLTIFKNTYNDQTVTPDDRDKIAAALKDLLQGFAARHFPEARKIIIKQFEAHEVENATHYYEILGFDSIAIYNPEIEIGINAPLTVQLVNSIYRASYEGQMSDEQIQDIKNIIINIERFQLRDELQAVSKEIYASDDFRQFPDKLKFREYVNTVLSRLRDFDYDYQPVKGTLRSFILAWNQQYTQEDMEHYRLGPLFEFIRYAGEHASRN